MKSKNFKKNLVSIFLCLMFLSGNCIAGETTSTKGKKTQAISVTTTSKESGLRTNEAILAVASKYNVEISPQAAAVIKASGVSAMGMSSYLAAYKELYPEKTKLKEEDFLSLKYHMGPTPSNSEYGIIKLNSLPSGAEVFLDKYKVKVGRTPLSQIYPVGEYTFTLKNSNCEPIAKVYLINQKRPIEDTVKLKCKE